MMVTLGNKQIQISVKEHGAELSSLICGGREYLWQADERFWKRHSPVLFPIVGSVWQKQFRAKGAQYTMGQHGLARDMDFTLSSQTDNEVWFTLESSQETISKYPYQFKLEIGYRIEGTCVSVIWRVTNPGAETLDFQIGAHPAFHWPMLTSEQIASGTSAMVAALDPGISTSRGWFKLEPCLSSYRSSQITEGGCVDPAKCNEIISEDGYIKLDTASFDADAFILEDKQVQKVTLCAEDKTPYLTLEFDAPLVGLWSPPGKNAPFVCIEPWYGRTDDVNYSGEFKDRKWMQHLEPGCTFESIYKIIIPTE